MKVRELFDHEEYDAGFELLDGTPEKPVSQEVIMKAMRQLHARIERQAANYGGDVKAGVDKKTGKVNTSKHKFFPAVIAHP